MNSNDVFSYVKMFLHVSVFVHSLFQCLQSHPTEEAVSLENSGMHWFDSFSQMPNCVCVVHHYNYFNVFPLSLSLVVQAARMADDATVILVTWTVTDIEVTTLNLEMQEGGEGAWEPVPGGSGLSTSETELKVNDLDADKSYKFRMDMRRPGEKNPVYVLSNTG